MFKHASSASYSFSGIGHPPHRSGCVFVVVLLFTELELSLDFCEVELVLASLGELSQ